MSFWKGLLGKLVGPREATQQETPAPLGRGTLGARGEEAACAFLARRGYTVLERNFRCPRGEIDVVARQGETLVFVEVRTRRSRQFGGPEESLTPLKGKHLTLAAQWYLQSYRREVPWRIDLVAVDADPQGNITQVRLIESAVEGGEA